MLMVYHKITRWAAAGIVVDSGDGWILAETWRRLPVPAFSHPVRYIDWAGAFALFARVARSVEDEAVSLYLAASAFITRI